MRIPVTNNTKMPIYCGSSMIPPGETRDFEEHQVPMHLRPKVAVPVKPEKQETDEERKQRMMNHFRSQSVADIVPMLGAAPVEALEELKALELSDPKPRQDLLDAIEQDLLRRSAGNTNNINVAELRAESVDKIVAAFVDLTDEQLSELESLEQADEKPRKTLLEAIAEEVLNRAGKL